MKLRAHIENARRELERDEQGRATRSLLAALEQVDLALADLRQAHCARDLQDAVHEHRVDREIVASVHRRGRAVAGHGYSFEPPPSLRRAA